MRHITLQYNSDAHYAVATNGLGKLLLQVQDEYGSQVRVILNKNEAQDLLNELRHSIVELDKELNKDFIK